MHKDAVSATDENFRADKSKRIPFGERLTCSVRDAANASGLGRSTIYNKMKSGEIAWIKVGARRLIKVSSLRRLLGE